MITLRPYFTEGFERMDELLEGMLSYFPENLFEIKDPEIFTISIYDRPGGIIVGYFDEWITRFVDFLQHNPDEILFLAMQRPLVSERMTQEDFEKSLVVGSVIPLGDKLSDKYYFAFASSHGMEEHFDRVVKAATQQISLPIVQNYCVNQKCLLYAQQMTVLPQDETRLQLSTRWMDKVQGFCEEHSEKILESMLG